MSKIISKTREGAKVSSRSADYLEYRQNTNNPIIGSTNDIGSLSTDQTSKGVWYPTVQAAIEDLYSLGVGNVGDVKINTTGTMPSGVSQLGRVTFDGTVNIIQFNESTPTTVIIDVMGIPVELVQGETSDQVAAKFANAGKELMLKNKLFSSVDQMSDNPSSVEFQHNDYRTHEYDSMMKKYGLSISFNVSSPCRNGIGTWVLLGQEAKTFPGSDDTVTLYYYKRIA